MAKTVEQYRKAIAEDPFHARPWAGTVKRLIEISCYDCCNYDHLDTLRTAKELGWRKIKSRWMCPNCPRRPKEM